MNFFCKNHHAGWRVLLCTVCVVIALLSTVTGVYAAGAASVSGSTTSAEKGDTVTVSFSLSKNPGIWGAKGEITYDNSVMTLKSVESGNVFSAGEVMLGENLKQNPFVFAATGNTIENKTKDGTLIKATFVMKDDVPPGDYAVGLRISQLINVDGADVAVSISGGKVTVVNCLHRKTYKENVVKATAESEGYSGDVFCSKCGMLLEYGSVTPVYVNTCKHPNQTETVVKEATCEKPGEIKMSCPDCQEETTKEIPATGHAVTELKDAKPATTTEEGFTGNLCCKTCKKVITKGSVISKIPILVFNMAMQTEDTYFRASQAGLVFVSDAQFDTFVRVEVNGTVLNEKDYTLENDGTKVTLKPEYLETLANGKHTVTIVSDAGTASAQFYVAVPPVEEIPEEPEQPLISNKALLIIAITAVVVALACVAYTVITSVRNNKRGRYSTNED